MDWGPTDPLDGLIPGFDPTSGGGDGGDSGGDSGGDPWGGDDGGGEYGDSRAAVQSLSRLSSSAVVANDRLLFSDAPVSSLIHAMASMSSSLTVSTSSFVDEIRTAPHLEANHLR